MRVLLVLRAMNPGIVAHGEHQPAVHPDIGLRHERVGGDVEADMFHGGERAPAGKGGADRNIKRDLFVGRPLRVQVLSRIAGQGLENFGAGRAGIGGGDFHAGFPGAARDRFIAGQRPNLFRLRGRTFDSLDDDVHLLPRRRISPFWSIIIAQSGVGVIELNQAVIIQSRRGPQ